MIILTFGRVGLWKQNPKQMKTLIVISPENETMKFNCPTLKKAQELAEVMKREGFTLVKIDKNSKQIKSRNQLFEEISKGLDVSKINLAKLNRSELIELAYALDWNGSWDTDEEGQKPITKKELIEAIKNLVSYL